MKRNGILNSDISRVLSYMGHTDWIAIGDCGLPIPDEVERIDLALTFGEPGFMRTLEIVAGDMKVEKIILAEEIKEQALKEGMHTLRMSATEYVLDGTTSINEMMKEQNPEVLNQVKEYFSGQPVEVEFVSHVELKAKTHDCKAVIRTGEITPYANIILQSGCIFA